MSRKKQKGKKTQKGKGALRIGFARRPQRLFPVAFSPAGLGHRYGRIWVGKVRESGSGVEILRLSSYNGRY